MKGIPTRFFTASVSKEQAKDSGMALVLILLLTGILSGHNPWIIAAAAALLMNMIYPMFFYFFAIFWLGLSGILGLVVSKIILSVIYFILVLPMALIRKSMGKDPLLLKKFKNGNESVLKSRNQTFQPADLEKPY